MSITTRSVSLQSSGLDSVWKALKDEGYADNDLGGLSPLLAWVAKENGISDFRALKSGSVLKIPARDSQETVESAVRANPAAYDAAMDAVARDVVAWVNAYASRAKAGATGLAPPSAKAGVGLRSGVFLAPLRGANDVRVGEGRSRSGKEIARILEQGMKNHPELTRRVMERNGIVRQNDDFFVKIEQ
jgi:hypothetical protein